MKRLKWVDLTEKEKKTAIAKGLHRNTVESRIERGMPVSEAVSRPVHKTGATIGGFYLSEAMMLEAEARGIPRKTVKTRVYKGWDLKRALNEPFIPRKSDNGMNQRDFKSLLETVGRIKYMQRTDPRNAPPITKRMTKDLKAMGKKIKDVKEIKVN